MNSEGFDKVAENRRCLSATRLGRKGNILLYRERHLANFFRRPGESFGDVLAVNANGIACRNVRIALKYLGFNVLEGDT